jgi:hypothetical protein
MRRKSVWVVVIVVGALAATALGAGSDAYQGKIAGDGRLHFRARVSDGAIVRVAGLGWKRLAISCDQGRFAFRGGFKNRVFAVEGSSFHGSGRSGGTFVSHARVTGRFRGQGARATGTVRVHGDLDAQHTGCDSGVKRWWVHRQG